MKGVGPRLSMVGPILAVIGPILAMVGLQAQESTLDDVIARASAYVAAYQQRFSGVVSEEASVQLWTRRPGNRPVRRELISDVLLLQPPGARRYVLFRDVFNVDGRQVRDRDDRLQDLFLKPSASTSTQMLRILDESARYNLGDIKRTMNTPTLALILLDPQYRDRFRYERSSDHVVETLRDGAGADDDGAARFTPPPGIWVISFHETSRETLIATGDGGNIPANGRYWIEPDTGRVVMTELDLRHPTVEGLVDVAYAVEPSVGLLVPVAMRERYYNPRSREAIAGSAVYTKVRRFQVNATESVKDPAGTEPDR